MQVQHVCCAGLDVHKRSVVACILSGPPGVNPAREIASFGTATADLLEMAEVFKARGVTHVAMEATGNYWMPVHNLLEGLFALIVANAAHMKAVPGRKTDVKDAEWIADLLRHGLLRASFIPPRAQRDLREVTRHRSSLAGKRAQCANELQKALESANIKLSSVVSDITGVSATAMLEAMAAGQTDPRILAQFARTTLRTKIPQLEKALSGQLRLHHRLIIEQLLGSIGLLAAQIAQLDAYLETRLRANDDDIDRLDGIPGINRRSAEVVLAEIGTDLSRFANADRLSAWTGVCPGQHQSAGKRRCVKARKGNRALRAALVEAAKGAIHTKGCYFAAQYRRLAARRGPNKALLAVAHSLLVVIYHVLRDKVPYRELGSTFFDQLNPPRVIHRLTKRFEDLGYNVTLHPISAAP